MRLLHIHQGLSFLPFLPFIFILMVLTSWYKMAAWAPAIPTTFHSTTAKKTGTSPPQDISQKPHPLASLTSYWPDFRHMGAPSSDTTGKERDKEKGKRRKDIWGLCLFRVDTVIPPPLVCLWRPSSPSSPGGFFKCRNARGECLALWMSSPGGEWH